MSGALALTWFQHRRTKELCAGLDIELVVLATDLRGPLRYPVLGVRQLFGRAAIFINNTAADVRRGIEGLRLGRAQLEAEAERKRVELAERWSTSARNLVVSMGHRTGGFSARANELKVGTDLNRARDIYSTLDYER